MYPLHKRKARKVFAKARNACGAKPCKAKMRVSRRAHGRSAGNAAQGDECGVFAAPFWKKAISLFSRAAQKARMAKALVAPALVCKALRPLFLRDLQNAFLHLPNLQKERFSTFFDPKTPCFCLFCTMKEKTRALLF